MFKFIAYYILTVFVLQGYTLISKGYYSDFSLFENSPIEYLILTIIYLISFWVLNKNKFFIPFVTLPIYATLDIASLI